jgi:hypothetical protein
MAILSSHTHYLRDKTDAYVIIISLVSRRSILFFPFALSHYESPLDERLVPVSRVDYQNIILYAQHYYFYCHLIDIVFAVVDKSGKRIFSPQAKESK